MRSVRSLSIAPASGKSLSGLSTWSQIRPLLGSRRRTVAALAAGSIFSGLTEAAILGGLAQAAAALVNRQSHIHLAVASAHLSLSLGVLLGAVMVLALVRVGLQWVVSYYPARIAADLRADLSNELFAAFTRASWDVQSRDREGHFQELATDQVAQATIGALLATTLLVAALTFAVLLLSALALNPLAALLVLVAAIALSALLRPLSGLGNRQGHAVAHASLGYAGGINEAVRLAEETQVFGAAAAQRDRIERLVEEVRHPFFQTQFLSRFVSGLYQSLIFLLVAAALVALFATGAGHVASLGAVVLLLVRAGTYGQQGQAAYQGVRQTVPYLDRVRETQTRYSASAPPESAQPLPQIRTLAFENVSFAYEPGRPVLAEITFEVQAGKTIGIVGPSGAGKSTLVQLLLRLRTPDSGSYLVNGMPAHELSRHDWHRRVAYLPQEPRLLHASVAENIRFFREIPDDAVERAARLAGIHEEITAWTRGYQTIVGPRADAVSGGQQQRLCLARALAAQPDVLVLDEPTSALDSRSESLIQESLERLRGSLTVFIVAHRISTLDRCERVLVLLKGRVDAFDSSDRLQNSNDYYRSAHVPLVRL
jgi:ATP-binding cassette subfamily B protein